MPFVPRLLTHVLPMMSHDIDQVRIAANKVNTSLMDYIMSLSEDNYRPDNIPGAPIQLPSSLSALGKELTGIERRDSSLSSRLLKSVIRDQAIDARSVDGKGDGKGPRTPSRTPTPAEERAPSPKPLPELDYQGAVNALTLQFLNEHEATRVAAIAWLIMLHRMAPGKVGLLVVSSWTLTHSIADTLSRRWDFSRPFEDTFRPLRGRGDKRSLAALADLEK
jgi:vacuole morphology and inheritance protein 14